jgi:hypothetical protein
MRPTEFQKEFDEGAMKNLALGKSRVTLNDISEAERLLSEARGHVHRVYELKRGIHGGK